MASDVRLIRPSRQAGEVVGVDVSRWVEHIATTDSPDDVTSELCSKAGERDPIMV